jgi:hypothetical protein
MVREVEEILGVAGEETSESRIGEEGADLVLDWADGVLAIERVVPRIFVSPIGVHLFVRDPLEQLLPEVPVVEEAKDIRERRVAIFDQCKERIANEVFHANAPRIKQPARLLDVR